MATEGFPNAYDRALMAALKGALTEGGYVVETMAAEVQISKESLGRYLRCEREMGTGTFARICYVLGVTPAEMYARAERVLLRSSISKSVSPGTPSPRKANGSQHAAAPQGDPGE